MDRTRFSWCLVALALVAAGGCGGSKRLCVPGESVACVGPAGCPGGQVCAASGTAYGACDCGGDGGLPDAAGDGSPNDGAPAPQDGPLQTWDAPPPNTPDPGTGGSCVLDSDCTGADQGCAEISGPATTLDGGYHDHAGSCQTIGTRDGGVSCPEPTDQCVWFYWNPAVCYCLCPGAFSATFDGIPIYDSAATLPADPNGGTATFMTVLCDQDVPLMNGYGYGVHYGSGYSSPETALIFRAPGVNWIYRVDISDSGWDTTGHDLSSHGDGYDSVALWQNAVSGATITAQTLEAITAGGTLQLSSAPAFPTSGTSITASGSIQNGTLWLIESEFCGSHSRPCN